MELKRIAPQLVQKRVIPKESPIVLWYAEVLVSASQDMLSIEWFLPVYCDLIVQKSYYKATEPEDWRISIALVGKILALN